MKLYSNPVSSNARKVLMTADMLGISLDVEDVDLTKGEQRKPEFLKINPNGKVPVLVDGDFVLWESHAIQMYLADSKPGNTLYPSERRARADVHRWLFWSANHWNPAISIIAFERMLKPMLQLGEPDPVQIERGETLFAQFAQVLDQHLAAHAWVGGSNITLADLSIVAPLMYAVPSRLPVDRFAHVKRWAAAMQDLDAWKKTEPPGWGRGNCG